MNIIKKTLSALLSATIISSTLIGGFGATATENKPSEEKFSNSIFERYKNDKNKDTNNKVLVADSQFSICFPDLPYLLEIRKISLVVGTTMYLSINLASV